MAKLNHLEYPLFNLYNGWLWHRRTYSKVWTEYGLTRNEFDALVGAYWLEHSGRVVSYASLKAALGFNEKLSKGMLARLLDKGFMVVVLDKPRRYGISGRGFEALEFYSVEFRKLGARFG